MKLEITLLEEMIEVVNYFENLEETLEILKNKILKTE